MTQSSIKILITIEKVRTQAIHNKKRIFVPKLTDFTEL